MIGPTAWKFQRLRRVSRTPSSSLRKALLLDWMTPDLTTLSANQVGLRFERWLTIVSHVGRTMSSHKVIMTFVFDAADTLDTCLFEADKWVEDEVQDEKDGVSAASMAFSFLLKQSYICALMAMMAWSVTYVSWLTCVLLLWSCVLWMMRDRRRYTLMSSPWLVVYGNLIVILQYIYSFHSIQEVPGLFPKKDVPCRELASKVTDEQ